jgi:NAD(P)-dependent dehydrogenase (short-subunit alcohol dehydrogenase family)
MNTGLKGKSVLITGGASGIGLGIAKTLAEEGVNIAVASRNPSPDVVEELKALGVDAVAIKADVSKEDQVVSMVASAIEYFGQLDMYVNNAAWTWHEPITKLTTEAWWSTMQTNVAGCVFACREVSRHMIPRQQGSILIIGSTAMFNPLYNETSYRVSKTGLNVFMEVLAVELVLHKIRVNMIIPGAFDTRMVKDNNFFTAETERGKVSDIIFQEIPMRRIGEPKEVGPAAAFLLSDRLSSYITGETLVVDGGLKLRPLPLYTDNEITKMNAE